MKYKEISKEYSGTLAEYSYNYFKSKGINTIDFMTSHVELGAIAVNWYTKEVWNKHGTRELQRKVMNAIRYTKTGQELFIDTGRITDYAGMRGYNKPKRYRLKGTEDEETNMYA